MTEPRKTFNFNPPIEVQEDWIIGLSDLEVYNSIFNITEQNYKFELYKIPDEKSGGISYEKLKDEVKRDLDFSNITASDLQDNLIAPINIKEYKEQVTKRMKDDKCMPILAMYVVFIFQDFESFLRTEIELVEDDIKLVLNDYN